MTRVLKFDDTVVRIKSKPKKVEEELSNILKREGYEEQ